MRASTHGQRRALVEDREDDVERICRRRDVSERCAPPLRSERRPILVTGGAGFIGSHVVDALLAAATRCASLDACCPRRTASRRLPRPARRAGRGRRPRPRRRRARGRRGRRRLPPGGDGRSRRRPRRHRRLRRPQRPRHRRAAARARARAASAAASCSPRAWSSTARAATAAPEHGDRRARAARRRRPRRGPLRAAVPASAGAPLAPRGRARGRAARPAQRLRRDQARPGAPVRRLRARDGRAGDRAALPQRLRPADAARHALRRGRGDLPLARWRPAARRGSSRTAGSCATSSTSATSPAPTCSRSTAGGRPGAFNVASGTPRSVGEMARALHAAAGDGAPAPEVTGEWRRGDVRHVFAVAERAPSRARLPAREDFAGGHGRVGRGRWG